MSEEIILCKEIKNKPKKYCIFENCKTYANFNIKGGKPIYCSNHKMSNMINIKDKTCIFENCKTIPVFNFEDEKTALYCFIRKKENMVDIKNKTCKGLNCKTTPNRNYKGYCAYCFSHLFPNDPKTLQSYCKRNN